MENQIEKNMEHAMETGIIGYLTNRDYIRLYRDNRKENGSDMRI